MFLQSCWVGKRWSCGRLNSTGHFFLLLFIGNISKWSLKAVFVIGINKSKVHSELAVSKNCTKVLSKQIETLQRNALDSSQYLRREMIEINLVPEDIQDMQLEESICQALSLTGTPVSAGDHEVCHRMRRRDRVIVKFSSRKKWNDVIFKKKSLNGKSDELKNLVFTSEKLFISDSMYHENHQLFYRWTQLLKRRGLALQQLHLCKSWRELRCYKN